MSTTATPAAGSLAESTLAERVDLLHRELISQRKRTDLSAMVTGVLGVIILLVLAGFFYFGYSQFTEATQPERVVMAAQTYMEDQIQPARKMIEDEVTRSAPVWATTASNQAQEAMPKAREALEGHVLGRVDETLNQGLLMTNEQFKAFLQSNRASIEAGMKELASSPQLAETTISDLEKALEKQMKGDPQMQARELFTAIKMANEKVKKLREGVNLTSREQLERRLVMLGHRLLQDQASSSGKPLATLTPPAAPAGSLSGSSTAPAPAQEALAPLPPSKKRKDRSKD